LDPAEVMAIYNAGLVNMFTGKKEKSLEYFLRAESLGEEVFEVAFQIGRLYSETGAAEKGKNFLEKAVRLRPESSSALRYLGDCYAALNMSAEALRTYKKAVRLNPFDAASLSAIGYLFDVKGENPEIATVFCQHSVEIAPGNGLFRHRLGLLYLKQNRFDDALKEFIKAIELGHHDSIQLIEDIQTRRTAAAS
jgi:tetratricopeptide (TPR) repeat protein